jgi:hypothetical protein
MALLAVGIAATLVALRAESASASPATDHAAPVVTISLVIS